MNALRARLRADDPRDSGTSLVEVIVAMFIFAIISTGTIYSMMSVLQLTRDSRARHVATNLAAQEIDLARDVFDLFDLLDSERTVELNGDIFTVTRHTQWVSSEDLDLACGSGAGALRYKRVNVEVSWGGMNSGAEPARADTIIDPSARINDPTLGTILVSVRSASGGGSAGVSVTAVPSNPADGAVALVTTPEATDAQGCTYILKVKPGNYNVSISKSGFIDVKQQTSPVVTTSVAAGKSASVGFQYDRASAITVNYASNYPSGTMHFPRNLDTSYHAFDVSITTLTGSSVNTTRSRTVSLHPFSSGYEVVAGEYIAPSEGSLGCVSVDPAAWPEVTIEGVVHAGERTAPVATVPGGTGSASVAMGVATIDGDDVGNLDDGRSHLKAVSVTPPGGSGDPGCAVPMTYFFGSVLDDDDDTRIALPYGSWKLYWGKANQENSEVPAGAITLDTRGIKTGNVLTFDPREPAS